MEVDSNLCARKYCVKAFEFRVLNWLFIIFFARVTSFPPFPNQGFMAVLLRFNTAIMGLWLTIFDVIVAVHIKIHSLCSLVRHCKILKHKSIPLEKAAVK